MCASVLGDGDTHYVNVSNSTPFSPYTNWTQAATSIQDAINVAVSGDTVRVTNGVYSTGGAVTPGASLTNRIAVTNAVLVESVNGPEETIILGQGPLGDSAIRCAYLASNAVLSGFTLSNGFTRTSGSYKNQEGGGAYFGTVNNCIISGNSAGFGGGTAYGTVNNCTISGNSGGGTEFCTVNNCTISGNSGGATYQDTINNSIVYYNSVNFSCATFRYSCTTPDPGGTGNITNEPRFVDYSGGDLHLRSSSMCINAGNNAYAPGTKDIEGNERIQASVVDIGAYESPYAPIDASAGPGGTITPAGRVGVVYNGTTNFDTTNFDIVAVLYYRIERIETNGADIAGSPYSDNTFTNTSYTWSNVTANGTLEA